MKEYMNWLIKNGCFLLVAIGSISLFLCSLHIMEAGFFLAVLLTSTYLLFIIKHKNVLGFERFLIVFLVILIIIGQNSFIRGVKGWNQLIQRKIEKSKIFEAGVKNGYPYVKIIEDVPTTITENTPTQIKASLQEDIKIAVKIEKPSNIINNGNFSIPLTDKFSKWGYGLYSDIIRSKYPNFDPIWINFLNADITITIVNTEKGNALKIDHKSPEQPNSVGILEQSVKLEKGKYRLSFWVKGQDVDEKPLWISTKDDWNTDPKQGGFELNRKGAFGWEFIDQPINVDSSGEHTFTIISKARGIIYITDVSLTKISE